MREEELEKRLQSAFPEIAPPDEALHARVQKLEVRTNISRRKARWKMAFIGVGIVGASTILVSRALVAYVLYQYQSTSEPRTRIKESKQYTNPYSIPLQRSWREGSKEITISYQYEQSSPSYAPIHHYQLELENSLYTWTQGEESDGDVFQVQRPTGRFRIFAGNRSGKPATPNWLQAAWSIPWLARLPDRFSKGHRQWVLQQTYREPKDSESHRVLWGIDAETRQVSWTEHWSSEGDTAEKLVTRDDYTYNMPIPAARFEVPQRLKNKASYGELSMASLEPAIRLYVAPLPWRDWWNGILVGQ